MSVGRWLEILAALFALGAGVLWFLSALVKTPASFDIAVDITRATCDGSVGGTGYSMQLSQLAHALKTQSRRNGYAALCFCAAALLAAARLFIG
jgi:hypothetical protein